MSWRCIQSLLSGIFISSTRTHVLTPHLLEVAACPSYSQESQKSAGVKYNSASSQHNFKFWLQELEQLRVQIPAFGQLSVEKFCFTKHEGLIRVHHEKRGLGRRRRSKGHTTCEGHQEPSMQVSYCWYPCGNKVNGRTLRHCRTMTIHDLESIVLS